jgi:hypothetical protein
MQHYLRFYNLKFLPSGLQTIWKNLDNVSHIIDKLSENELLHYDMFLQDLKPIFQFDFSFRPVKIHWLQPCSLILISKIETIVEKDREVLCLEGYSNLCCSIFLGCIACVYHVHYMHWSVRQTQQFAKNICANSSKIMRSVLNEILCVEMKSPTLLIILGWVFLWKICKNAQKKYRTT